MSNMKSCNSLYYIDNTPWTKKTNIENIKRFNSIRYSDSIILHFDFVYSVLKLPATEQRKLNNTIFISAINVCLRIYNLIKKLYPYNTVYVIIHTKNKMNLTRIINFETFKAIIDILPNFAIIAEDSLDDLLYFNNKDYKHIFYGNCNRVKNIFDTDLTELQSWSFIKGNLIVR